MVDLVKIRKKSKQQAADAAAAQETPPAVSESSAPAAEASSPEAAAPPPEVPDTPVKEAAPVPAASETAGIQSKLDRFKLEAGRRREEESRVAQEEAEDPDRLELLTFVIAAEQYAIEIDRIVEIVPPRTVTRIPNADSSVVGILSLRGTIVTLVDVRQKLHHPAAGASNDDTRIIVIDFLGETIGFLVDRVLRVVKTVQGAIEPHPVVSSTELDDSVRGVFRAGDSLTILLDLDKLLDSRALAVTPA